MKRFILVFMVLSGLGLGAQNKAPNDLIRVQGGTFIMGSPLTEVGRKKDEIQHPVSISTFYMSKYEITFDEYDAYAVATGKEKPSDSGWGRGQRPVINVSWDDAVAYCNWRSLKEGFTPVYGVKKGLRGPEVTCDWSATGYRLPTEAEWEYACRGGTTTPFSTGDNLTTAQANYDGNFPYGDKPKGEYRKKTLPVGSFKPNAFGFYDLHGNVWEWCWDLDWDYESSAQKDPRSPWYIAGIYTRILRGGSWFIFASFLRSADRYGSAPAARTNLVGFRVVQVP